MASLTAAQLQEQLLSILASEPASAGKPSVSEDGPKPTAHHTRYYFQDSLVVFSVRHVLSCPRRHAKQLGLFRWKESFGRYIDIISSENPRSSNPCFSFHKERKSLKARAIRSLSLYQALPKQRWKSCLTTFTKGALDMSCLICIDNGDFSGPGSSNTSSILRHEVQPHPRGLSLPQTRSRWSRSSIS